MKNNFINLLIKIFNYPLWEQNVEIKLNERIIEKFVLINMKLPKTIGYISLIFVEYLAIISSRYFMFINKLYQDIYLIEGKENNGVNNKTIIYISNSTKFPHLQNKLFKGDIKIKKISKCLIWNIKKKIDNFTFNFDAVYIKSDVFFSKYFEKNGFFVIPEFVSVALDISKPIEEIISNFKRSTKEDINKIKKVGYEYEISDDIEKLKMFFYEMYLPYIKDRYKELSRLTYYNFVKFLFEKNSKLILIKLNNEYLSGALFSISKNKIRTSFTGLKKGKTKYLKQGLGAAPYYFLIKWAKQNGFLEVNFGNCNPFLKDGLLRYKIKWGAEIKKSVSNYPNIYALKVVKNNPAIDNFLINNPMIILENDNLKGLLFFENIEKDKSNKIKKVVNDYKKYYLKDLVIKTIKD